MQSGGILECICQHMRECHVPSPCINMKRQENAHPPISPRSLRRRPPPFPPPPPSHLFVEVRAQLPLIGVDAVHAKSCEVVAGCAQANRLRDGGRARLEA
ncbi:hypothetical protein F751_3819 [Auxenochlorella protothecoides]|uniref:Uncharacterized protein n=1 Tax=Auxenochlorella protothecoides TaxID=3075 RepID=A0A087SRF5_AUXPR|nr:hypothetical protein F751_3819 [Auxenochlorella protothecoides]KFM28309.1 hypothetical protein F751_3819 [Auxenochlorella protothecoides]